MTDLLYWNCALKPTTTVLLIFDYAFVICGVTDRNQSYVATCTNEI